MFSGIRLGDGYLNLYDLYQMRFDARLVTLSGCATGMNFVAAGDELLGLQRGLFCAGATTLLLSLWDVHDQSNRAVDAATFIETTFKLVRWLARSKAPCRKFAARIPTPTSGPPSSWSAKSLIPQDLSDFLPLIFIGALAPLIPRGS